MFRFQSGLKDLPADSFFSSWVNFIKKKYQSEIVLEIQRVLGTYTYFLKLGR